MYGKRDDFTFPIVNFPFQSINISASPVYGVYITHTLFESLFIVQWFSKISNRVGVLSKAGTAYPMLTPWLLVWSVLLIFPVICFAFYFCRCFACLRLVSSVSNVVSVSELSILICSISFLKRLFIVGLLNNNFVIRKNEKKTPTQLQKLTKLIDKS